jgi:hypothetical protein
MSIFYHTTFIVYIKSFKPLANIWNLLVWKVAVVKVIHYPLIYSLLVLSCFPYKLNQIPKAFSKSTNNNKPSISLYPRFRPSKIFFIAFFSVTVDGRNPEKNATKNEHICSMCRKINKVGKQEVGIWRVQKRYPQYGIPIWCLWPNIRFLQSTVTEKNATKNILDGRTEVKQHTPFPLRAAGVLLYYVIRLLFSYYQL